MSDPIEIKVFTQYVEQQSEPQNERYVFAYTITITNRADEPAQLLNRHWLITDALGEVEEVMGEGVVGKQPRLESDQSFQYTSGAILKTPVGSMHGSYEFRRDDGTKFEVPIPAFSLSVPNVVH